MDKNSFLPTPPMGWNSYDYYDTTVDEARVRANADYMAAHLKAYGWEYVVIDIEWYAHGAGSMRDRYQYIPFAKPEMDEYSRLLPDPARYPSSADGAGFRPLADYIHSLGLKFGIHIMRGIPRYAAHSHTKVKGSALDAADIADPFSISRWNPDMYGVRDIPEGQAYYDSLLELYASWGVDFIKCDDICNTNAYPHKPYSGRHEIEMIRRAIDRCGRPIVLSLSPGPALIEQSWHLKTNANMWRITDDFWDEWELLKDMFGRCEFWQDHVSEGCFPDCDMLPVGRLGKGFGNERVTNFTKDEQRTMMTLWCVFGSPLMIGAELTKLDDWTLSLLTNDAVLALGSPQYRPRQIRRSDSDAVWTAKKDGEEVLYVALFNLSDAGAEVSVSAEALGLPADAELTLTDLWEAGKSFPASGAVAAVLPAHASALYRIIVNL